MQPSCTRLEPCLDTKNSQSQSLLTKTGEVIVNVHAASLKPIDKQLASGSHYEYRSQLLRTLGRVISQAADR
jgi:NADPH:quinone reductase-like Zn-dependent oxidoreductase